MNLQEIDAAASPEVQMNENFETLDHQAVYGKRQPVTTGLTWGYYGGRWGGVAVTAGTLTLTNAATNYIVVLKSTGAISVSTASTNWDDTVLYSRVYKLTTAGSVVTATEDHRVGVYGVMGFDASVVVANEATDTTCFVTFVTTATGQQQIKTNANLTFNSNTGAFGASTLTATGGAGAASLTLPATGRLYLDGGSNTYIVESSADAVDIVVGASDMLRVNASGVGVGATAAGSTIRFRVSGNYTDIAGTTELVFISGTHTLTANNAIAFRGLDSNPTLNQDAFNATVTASSGGGVQGLTGRPTVSGASGTVTAALGAFTDVRNTGAGIITDAIGYGTLFLNSGGGSITRATSFYAPANTVGTTRYGFRGLLASDGTNAWNLFMDGTAPNHVEGNLVIGGTAFDSTGTQTLTITTGTAPAAGVADTVAVYSSDDAAGHTVPSFYCEGTNVVATGQADSVSSVRVKMRINGTVRTFLCI